MKRIKHKHKKDRTVAKRFWNGFDLLVKGWADDTKEAAEKARELKADKGK